MSKHIVTAIKPYNFVDQDGQSFQGVKVYYLDNVAEDSNGVNGAKGFFPLNLSITGGDHVSKFNSIPGIYDLDFKQVSDKFGKPILKLRNVDFIKPVTLPTI